ncbi:MAG: YIP1 family protein [Melioribacteraceae bacterium]|nr:YIP1 family protein [Melioribacteraceae bacterium]
MSDLENPKFSEVEDVMEETDETLNHTDKLVGVFTEPSNLFQRMSTMSPKTTDWIIPLLILIVAASLSNFIMMSNPVIKHNMVEKQMTEIEKQFDQMVKEGKMTEEVKNQQLDAIQERMSEGAGMQAVFTVIGIFIIMFVSFFVISGVFFLIIKFLLGGDGTYKVAMSAYGLPYYIIVVQIVAMVILALVTDRFFASTSVASIMGLDVNSLPNWLLSKLDVFSIWFYAIISIGFAKMFKAKSVVPYFATVFGLWLGFGLVMFYLAQSFPFLKAFAGN